MFSVIAIKVVIFISLFFTILRFFNENSFSWTREELSVSFSLIINDRREDISFWEVLIIRDTLFIQQLLIAKLLTYCFIVFSILSNTFDFLHVLSDCSYILNFLWDRFNTYNSLLSAWFQLNIIHLISKIYVCSCEIFHNHFFEMI